MAAATEAWEGSGRLCHDVDQTARQADERVGGVRRASVDVGGQYLARAFSRTSPAPSERPDRRSCSSSSRAEAAARRHPAHELGHALGFRHEHTRPSAGPCFEDDEWRGLTAYDPLSVMHYPQCNGQGDWSLTLTARDDSGAACLYGPAPAFTIDPTLVTATSCRTPAPAPPTGVAKRQVFSGQSVALGAQKEYGPFAVVSGSLFEATMTGTGDPDLYVRFGAKPTTASYNCRPYSRRRARRARSTPPPARPGPS
jgi:hypothetical protein